VIYSRYELNSLMLNRAAAAGAQLEKTRVREITRRGAGWLLHTRAGKIDADFCVVATGARNSLRNVGIEWSAGDTMIGLGYYVPTDQAHIDIQFYPRFEGYIWVFPRNGHLSVGICGKGESAGSLRTRLEAYMRLKGLNIAGSQLYAHVLPSLEKSSWRANRVAGEGWLAVGDAAGLVDPITGEGIYYAVRSADLAAGLLISGAHAPAAQPEAYRSLLEHDFTADLEFAARLAKRLFLGSFLYKDVPARMIQFMRKSPTYCELMQDLFAGTQNYLDLKSRLMRSLHGTLQEVMINAFLRRLIPSTGRI
jgi:Dehydrogenases (flavoproteins)